MEAVNLFSRSAEEAADIGKGEFSFTVLRELHNAEQTGALDKQIDPSRIGRVRVVGYARNVRTGQSFRIDKRSAYHVVGSGRNAIAAVRAVMRDEVAARTGLPSGSVESFFEYVTESVDIEYRAPSPPPVRRPPPSQVFKKQGGKWMKKVKGYTRKDGKKVKGHFRKSSRAEYLRYKNAK